MPLDINGAIADRLGGGVRPAQVEQAVRLLDEGATVPFISRYRKERTGGLDDGQLRTLSEQLAQLRSLEARKATVIASIEAQDKLTSTLRRQIEECRDRVALEDLYVPFRPRKRTRAVAARERGLEPLAMELRSLRREVESLERLAAPHVSPARGVNSVEEALAGAADIVAEQVAETPANRALVRGAMTKQGRLCSKVKKEFREVTTKFDHWKDYSSPVDRIPSHAYLALQRGEAEGVLKVDLVADDQILMDELVRREVRVGQPPPPRPGVAAERQPLRRFMEEAVRDGYGRLMKESLSREVRKLVKERAEREAVETFASNLRELLLAPPAGGRPTVAIDPGIRTGCKVAVLDGTGRVLDHGVIYLLGQGPQQEQAHRRLEGWIRKHKAELIAIGNGTGSRETDSFVAGVLRGYSPPDSPLKVIVSEAGASVYSASEVGAAELPELDVTIRGAVSIGRRLQDPLAELVKIDPRAIGVGQYQHDVDEKLLREKLDSVVEDCVNKVGVEVNSASAPLLSHVAGLGPQLAANIVAHRDARGPFQDRRELLKVPRLGPRAFEQAAGFLRIRQGKNPLDNSAVHPESYPLVEEVARQVGISVQALIGNGEALSRVRPQLLVERGYGLPTVNDVLAELAKPGRDPRARFQYASFREDVHDIKDLEEGMELEGVVTNVVDFGAFVDIGVHQDGLVHISVLADRFVRHPSQVVAAGQVVRVKVIGVDLARRRISLSMNTTTLNTNH